MKISLKLANGAVLEFEGDKSEFERLSKFLESPPESLAAATNAEQSRFETSGQGENESPPPAPVSSLEPSAVVARFEQVGARNDQERVTVIAQMAVEGGREGIDYDTLNQLYTELGLRKPAQFPSKTFANAKGSGLVKAVKPGLWRPTYKGENFSRGHGRGERQQARHPGSRSKGSTSNSGGDRD